LSYYRDPKYLDIGQMFILFSTSLGFADKTIALVLYLSNRTVWLIYMPRETCEVSRSACPSVCSLAYLINDMSSASARHVSGGTPTPLKICCWSQFLGEKDILCCWNIRRHSSNQMRFLDAKLAKTAHATGAAPEIPLAKTAYNASHTT